MDVPSTSEDSGTELAESGLRENTDSSAREDSLQGDLNVELQDLVRCDSHCAEDHKEEIKLEKEQLARALSEVKELEYLTERHAKDLREAANRNRKLMNPGHHKNPP